ncbi:glycosyltransferase family 2 protein [Desulfitibacter alkalitolerans]|uniref:glycosyltransferase family 2 protein n=1 Tax=Desulfitibacter alkalitolerans TaxID=264641 RepID=UPI000484C8C2|nr:glycosyltransferase family 2 protein [Desulfitibacter alkalitolerans]
MKVTVVIPAYNEENNIGNVLKVLVGIKLLDEIIVVDDGSSDRTAQVAASYGVKVIRLKENLGKGGAMMEGAKLALHPNILFLDADLIGLKEEHINKLIQPVIEEGYVMTVGVFEHGRIATDLAQFLAPFLSGQRVVGKELFSQISNLDATRFGVEVALTKYARDNHLPVKEVILEDLTHVMKEEKLGLIKGFLARMKMYWEIAKFVSTNIKTGTKD